MAALMACAVVGCSVDQSTPTPAPALRGTPIPTDFTFSNTQTVSVAVSVTRDAINGQAMGALEVADVNGNILYQGPVSPGSPAAVHLAFPRGDSQVQVTLRAEGVEKKASAQIANGAVAHDFK